MRKFFTMIMLGAAVFAFTGCGGKSEEKALEDEKTDLSKKAAEMQKEGEKAAKDMQKEAEKVKLPKIGE